MPKGGAQSILLAVLGALVITAIITGYASVKTGELQEFLDRVGDRISSVAPDLNLDVTGFLLALDSGKEKKVKVEGTLSLNSPVSLSFTEENPLSRLEVTLQKGSGTVRLGNILVGEGVDSIILENYTGRVEYSGGTLELSGRTASATLVVDSTRVPLAGARTPIEIGTTDFFAPGLYLYGVFDKNLFLENATGTLAVSTPEEQATITKTNGNIRIKGFSGDLTLSPSSISLKGDGVIKTSLFESKG